MPDVGTPARRANRSLPRQQRIDLQASRAPTNREWCDAVTDIGASGVIGPVERRLKLQDRTSSRLSTKGLLVALSLVAYETGHRALIVQVVKLLNSFTPKRLNELAMPHWPNNSSGYDLVQRRVTQLTEALNEGWAEVNTETGEIFDFDIDWYTRSIQRSTVPVELVKGAALAVDGTDMESCGQFHSGETEIVHDGEAQYPNDEDETDNPKSKTVKTRRAKVLGIGSDNRKIYTRDTDARAGHRTATNTRPTKLYVGRELHLGVAVSALDHTDRIAYANLGRPVPQVVITSALVPAGAHRAKAVVDGVIEAHQSGLCSEVLVDGGYSLSKPEHFHQRLHEAGIDQTIRILTHQRGPHGSIGDAVLVDGQPFSGHLPTGEHQLDMPGRNADDATRRACVEKFNERAKLRYTVHTKKADGTVRYKCPFCAGRAHSPKFPRTMKSRNKNSRLVQPGKTAKTCCNGVVTADTDVTFLDQKTIFGTTAWWKAWGRRNIVESANAAFHGEYVDIGRNYTRFLKTTKIQMFLAHTIAGYNRRTVKHWRRLRELCDTQAPVKAKRKARKNRRRRYEDLPSAKTDTNSDP